MRGTVQYFGGHRLGAPQFATPREGDQRHRAPSCTHRRWKHGLCRRQDAIADFAAPVLFVHMGASRGWLRRDGRWPHHAAARRVGALTSVQEAFERIAFSAAASAVRAAARAHRWLRHHRHAPADHQPNKRAARTARTVWNGARSGYRWHSIGNSRGSSRPACPRADLGSAARGRSRCYCQERWTACTPSRSATARSSPYSSMLVFGERRAAPSAEGSRGRQRPLRATSGDKEQLNCRTI